MSKIYESGEDYLEVILELLEEKSEVRAIDIVNRMNVSRPSVSVALKILKENGYLVIDSKNRIHFTDSGLATANKIMERHLIITKYLIHLGVSESVAKADACKMEHDISEETFTKIKEAVILLNEQN